MEVVHFFSQDLMGGTNIFCFVSEGLDDWGFFWLRLDGGSSNPSSNWCGLIFLNTEVDMVESGLGEHLVSRNKILPSLAGVSMVNLMLGSTDFK